MQIKTGEGKSIVAACTLSILALHGYDVYCACYSKHLIQRDFDEFKFVFEALTVHNFVEYGTIEELIENLLNSQGDIRGKVEDLILKD